MVSYRRPRRKLEYGQTYTFVVKLWLKPRETDGLEPECRASHVTLVPAGSAIVATLFAWWK